MNYKPTHQTPDGIDPDDIYSNRKRSAIVPLEPTSPVSPAAWAHPAPEDGCSYRHDEPHTSETRADIFELEPLSTFIADNPIPRYIGARRRWSPWASIGLYVFAQLVLAIAMGLGHIPAAGGAAVCLTLLICGLVLIACQVLAERSRGGPSL